MTTARYLVVALLGVAACWRSGAAGTAGLPERLFDVIWVHSHEEDSDRGQVYRPRGYSFPPSRGREGFELKRDGSFVEFGIAPADGSTRETGRWKLTSDGLIEVDPAKPTARLYRVKVLSLENDVLTVRKLPARE